MCGRSSHGGAHGGILQSTGAGLTSGPHRVNTEDLLLLRVQSIIRASVKYEVKYVVGKGSLSLFKVTHISSD